MSKFTLLLGNILPENLQKKLRGLRDSLLRPNINIELPNEIYKEDIPKKKISFCTNIMNRTYQLDKTYLKNIKNNMSYPNIEFILINYNSQDDLDVWVKENLADFIEKGIVKYFRTYEPNTYHLCKAKNLAHQLASGEILCNLDGDNYTGEHFAFYINYLFYQRGKNNIFQFTKPPYWGTVGRIVIHREFFNQLGGYDESFYPVGHDDIDFLDRAKALGLKHQEITIPNFLKYISNSTKEKVENSGFKKHEYYKLEKKNMHTSEQNIKKGLLKANTKYRNRYEVYKNFEKKPYTAKKNADDNN